MGENPAEAFVQAGPFADGAERKRQRQRQSGSGVDPARPKRNASSGRCACARRCRPHRFSARLDDADRRQRDVVAGTAQSAAQASGCRCPVGDAPTQTSSSAFQISRIGSVAAYDDDDGLRVFGRIDADGRQIGASIGVGHAVVAGVGMRRRGHQIIVERGRFPRAERRRRSNEETPPETDFGVVDADRTLHHHGGAYNLLSFVLFIFVFIYLFLYGKHIGLPLGLELFFLNVVFRHDGSACFPNDGETRVAWQPFNNVICSIRITLTCD